MTGRLPPNNCMAGGVILTNVYFKQSPTMEKKAPSTARSQKVKDALDYPGIATDRSDNDKTNDCLVKEDVRELNNNPRNGDMERK